MNLRRSGARGTAVSGLWQPQLWPIPATVVAMATAAAAMAMAMATTGQWQWQPKRECRTLPRTCRSRLAGEPVRSGTHDVFDQARSPASRFLQIASSPVRFLHRPPRTPKPPAPTKKAPILGALSSVQQARSALRAASLGQPEHQQQQIMVRPGGITDLGHARQWAMAFAMHRTQNPWPGLLPGSHRNGRHAQCPDQKQTSCHF